MKKYIRPDYRYPEHWNKLRFYIFKRDGYKCQKCGSKLHLQCHHIIPIYMGGSHHPNNLVTLCDICHGIVEKSIRTKRI
jgi:5-methylcytosine-specific restriction endonuclease McrA